MSLGTLVFRYAAFAVIATIVNLGTQRLVLAWDESAVGFALAVFMGTLVGLVQMLGNLEKIQYITVNYKTLTDPAFLSFVFVLFFCML